MREKVHPARRCKTAIILLSVLAVTVPAMCETAGKIRPAALAGSWYPAQPAIVAVEIDRMIRAAESAPVLSGRPVALVVPHAGWRYSGTAAAAAFGNLHPGDFDRVVVIAPSHRGSFSGFSVPDVTAYASPLGEVPVDIEAVRSLKDGELVRTVPGVHDREHAIEIEIPFLQCRLGKFTLVPILAGTTDAEMQRTLAAKLAKLHDNKTLFVFSSDFTHYGPRFDYTPFGKSAPDVREKIRALDEQAFACFSPPDAGAFRDYLEETSATVCGRHGLGVLLELIPLIAPGAKPVRLAYYRSIDLPGPADDNSVSYLSLAYIEGGGATGSPLALPPEYSLCPTDAPPIDRKLGGRLVDVARAALLTQIEGTDDLPLALNALGERRPELNCLQGVFVTLLRTDPGEMEREGKLRGCIGQVTPVYPLPEAVVMAAVQAALNDRRFSPVEGEELQRLAIELSVLTPSRPVDSWREIEIGRHGMIMSRDGRSAVYLPHVAVEQGWELEETLTHLSRKAGLPANAWREGATFKIFETQIFEEHQPKKEGGPGDEH